MSRRGVLAARWRCSLELRYFLSAPPLDPGTSFASRPRGVRDDPRARHERRPTMPMVMGGAAHTLAVLASYSCCCGRMVLLFFHG